MEKNRSIQPWQTPIRKAVQPPFDLSRFLLTFLFSHHIPLLSCLSPSTVRERLSCCDEGPLSDSSHSIDWRDDPPQEVRALRQDFLHNAQTSDFILCHLLVSFAIVLKVHVSFFQVFTTTSLHHKVTAPHHLGTTVCIRTFLDLFQNLSERGFLLSLTLYLFLLFPTRFRQNISCFCPSKRKVLAHSAQKLFISHHNPNPSTMRLLPYNPFSFVIISVAVCLAASTFHCGTAETN